MSRAGYEDIRTADQNEGRCGSCGNDIEEGSEYAANDSGLFICDACLTILEDEDAKQSA